MLVKDTLIVPLSDMHSGGDTALFPNRFWQFKHSNHTPTAKQKMIFRHFDKCAEYVKKHRQDKRVLVVHNGDALEGVHHSTLEVVTFLRDEQVDIHLELMDYFLNKIGFDGRKGDKLYYTIGTEAHTADKEDRIAKELPVQKTDDGGHVHQELLLNVNGRRVLFLHHGPKRGEGATEGNPLRAWLGRMYWTNLAKGRPQPDLVFTGHWHTPAYNTYVHNWQTIHGIISPSWQAKTRYAHEKVPETVNEIGAIVVEVKADGEIKQPVPLLIETDVLKAKAL